MTTIKELKELDAKATSAPWNKCETIISGATTHWHITGDKYGSAYPICNHTIEVNPSGEEQLYNAKLIAATRNALPEIIRVIELAESALQNADNAVWADIVSGAFPQRTQLRNQIQQALSEIRKLKGE